MKQVLKSNHIAALLFLALQLLTGAAYAQSGFGVPEIVIEVRPETPPLAFHKSRVDVTIDRIHGVSISERGAIIEGSDNHTTIILNILDASISASGDGKSCGLVAYEAWQAGLGINFSGEGHGFIRPTLRFINVTSVFKCSIKAADVPIDSTRSK